VNDVGPESPQFGHQARESLRVIAPPNRASEPGHSHRDDTLSIQRFDHLDLARRDVAGVKARLEALGRKP
jgi:hypothetical protein